MIGWLGKQGLSKEIKLELVLSVSHCGQGLGKEPSRWKVQTGETLLRTESRPGCWSGESKGSHHWGASLRAVEARERVQWEGFGC